LSLGCFNTHAAMISQTSCCPTGLAAVNWYKLIITNLPPLLVVSSNMYQVLLLLTLHMMHLYCYLPMLHVAKIL